VVLSTAILNFVLLPRVNNVVQKYYENLRLNEDVYSEDKIETIVQIHLLVSGVLAFSAVLFQAVCMSSVYGLGQSLQRWKSHCAQRSVMLRSKMSLAMAGGSLAELNKLDQWVYSDDFLVSASLRTEKGMLVTMSDKLILVWSILMGLFHIYLNGTYAMFAYRIVDSESSSAWFISLWQHMGKYDTRYTTADDFLVSSNGIMATVVGPLLLVYAWSIVSGRSFRQVCGIVVNSVEIYTQVLYFAIEMQNRFENISVKNPTMFTLVFILYNMLRLIVPIMIVCHEVRTVVSIVHHSTARVDEEKELQSFEEAGHTAPEMASRIASSASYNKDNNWAKYLSMRKRRNSIDPSDAV
ncbi:Ebp, partial [Symbiodinium microadriaticum]